MAYRLATVLTINILHLYLPFGSNSRLRALLSTILDPSVRSSLLGRSDSSSRGGGSIIIIVKTRIVHNLRR